MWTLLAIAVAIAAGSWVWSSRRVAEAELRIQRTERRADSLTAAYRDSKRQLTTEQTLSRHVERRALADGERLREQLRRVRSVNDSLRTDTSDAVQVVIIHSDSLAALTDSFVSLIDTLRDQHARERRSAAAALADADSLIAVQNALNAALKAERCRVWGRPCPSRSQAFIGGALLVTLLVLR